MGTTETMYGAGIYAHDTIFQAPINRGTDAAWLVVGLPWLLIALWRDVRRGEPRDRQQLAGVLGALAYLALSLTLGITYNQLFLVYVVMLGCSLLATVLAIASLQRVRADSVTGFPRRGAIAFLSVAAIALFVAWLPDIIGTLGGGTVPLFEAYTTVATHVLDMAIVAPLLLAAAILLQRRTQLGYVLIPVVTIPCLLIGVILPVQTVFQLAAGIDLPAAALITKVATFCVLAVGSGWLLVQSWRRTTLHWDRQSQAASARVIGQ